MRTVILKDLRLCSEHQIKAVRDVRNQDSIRKAMYTEHVISLEEHLRWVENVKTDGRQIVCAVLIDDVVSGVVSVTALDRLHKKSDWAFYLDENTRGGLGAALEYAWLNFVFGELGLEKLNCEVIETNMPVVKLHKRFGFTEEGLRRENVIKDGQRVGVYFLGLTKSDWEAQRSSVYENYQSRLEAFDISIEYDGG